MCKHNPSNALVAEFWGIIFGLRLAKDMHLSHVILETDSLCICEMIHHRFTCCPQPKPHLSEVLCLINNSGWTLLISHNSRAANVCADSLANQGHASGFHLLVLDYVSPSLVLLLDNDKRGVCSPLVEP